MNSRPAIPKTPVSAALVQDVLNCLSAEDLQTLVRFLIKERPRISLAMGAHERGTQEASHEVDFLAFLQSCGAVEKEDSSD